MYSASSVCSLNTGDPDIISEHRAALGRLNTIHSAGAWCAERKYSEAGSKNQYLQIDLGKKMTVWSVATQGAHDIDSWITRYNLRFSNDGQGWEYYQKSPLTGNTDRDTQKRHLLTPPITARYFQFNPQEWNEPNGITKGQMCMRAGIFRCRDGMTTSGSKRDGNGVLDDIEGDFKISHHHPIAAKTLKNNGTTKEEAKVDNDDDVSPSVNSSTTNEAVEVEKSDDIGSEPTPDVTKDRSGTKRADISGRKSVASSASLSENKGVAHARKYIIGSRLQTFHINHGNRLQNSSDSVSMATSARRSMSLAPAGSVLTELHWSQPQGSDTETYTLHKRNKADKPKTAALVSSSTASSFHTAAKDASQANNLVAASKTARAVASFIAPMMSPAATGDTGGVDVAYVDYERLVRRSVADSASNSGSMSGRQTDRHFIPEDHKSAGHLKKHGAGHKRIFGVLRKILAKHMVKKRKG